MTHNIMDTVTLDPSGCRTSILENGSPILQHKQVSVSGTGASAIIGVATAELKLSAGGYVTAFFDSA